MIATRAQYRRAKKWLVTFEKAAKDVRTGVLPKDYDPAMREIVRLSLKSKADDLRRDIFIYEKRHKDEVKRPMIVLPKGLPKTLMRELPKMSRAQRWQAIRIAQGLCVSCGKEPLKGARLGEKCLKKQRERMRKKTGAERRNKSMSYAP